MDKIIDTMEGSAYYICTEIENVNGIWNDSYSICSGYYVIHKGNYHHIYKVR